MSSELYQLPEKIKQLREQQGLTQAELARKLHLSRSSINGWEMGLFVPSTTIIVQLSKLFHVTTDYLLGVEQSATLQADGLNEQEVAAVATLIHLLRTNKASNQTEGSSDV